MAGVGVFVGAIEVHTDGECGGFCFVLYMSVYYRGLGLDASGESIASTWTKRSKRNDTVPSSSATL